MLRKNRSKNNLKKAIISGFLMLFGLFGGMLIPSASEPAFAVRANTTDTTTVEAGAEENEETIDTGSRIAENNCKKVLGSAGWFICPITEGISKMVDTLYGLLERILVINPIPSEEGTPIYEIWKYCRGMTNVVFIIFLLIVIYSQLTGIGITNYGIKRTLPKLIIAAMLVNLSFLICSLAVDVSNILGNSLTGLFNSVAESAVAGNPESGGYGVSALEMFAAIGSGAALTIGGAAVAFNYALLFMLIPTALAGLFALLAGLFTLMLRQAVVPLLIMISPLAMVAYMLPNTEDWFKKWKKLLTQMLVFYPMFSILVGASHLAGFAIIASAKDGFAVLLGWAVQILPLFLSISLMKMSGTFLSSVNAKLNSLAAKPVAANRAWADSHRQLSSAYHKQYSKTPIGSLRRRLDNRKELRDQATDKLRSTRKSMANIYAQRKFSSGYDGTKAQGTSGDFKPNKYTKIAKDASTSSLLSETAMMDTKHALSNYGDYYVSNNVKERVKAAEKAGNMTLANRIQQNDTEFRRASKASKAFLEYSRAQMTAENDDEADFNYMVSQFLDASTKYDPNPKDGKIDEEAMAKYKHYIVSSAGGLGETGQTRVLGKIIARAAAVESNQRRDINIVAQKFPPDKRNFRNFLFNYYVDDDGYATDRDGNRIETLRDSLRVNNPEKLEMWDKYDENGPYFDWYDTSGAYVTRIYKKDKSAIKELMSNFDAPINDPINNLLAIHAGIKEQHNSDIPVLRNMGLDGFRTTAGRALTNFKEKNAAMSPMVAEMVKKGYIQNYAQLYLSYLDSFNKATKPGAFNVQDADAINMFAMMMDPDRWDEIFPTELIRGYRNVNGEQIKGLRYDEDGNKIDIPAEDATREELMNRVKDKYIFRAAPKITAMMSRQTQNTIDNQKPGTAAEWKALKEVLDVKWGKGKQVDVDPYKQDGNMREIVRDVKESIEQSNNSSRRSGTEGQVFNVMNRGQRPNQGAQPAIRVNHSARIYELYNSSLDADDFAVSVSKYCSGYVELAWISHQVQDFIVTEGYGVTKDQIYEFIEEQLAYVDND